MDPTRRPRNDLIRALRGQGWSYRRIAAHPKVGLSAAGVHAVVHGDDGGPVQLLLEHGGGRPVAEYALAAFRAMVSADEIRAVWVADRAAECAAVIAETGGRQYFHDIQGELAGIRARAGLPEFWWEAIPDWRVRLDVVIDSEDDDDGGDPPCGG